MQRVLSAGLALALLAPAGAAAADFPEIQKRGTLRKTALRAGHVQCLTRKDILELTRQAVNRVPLRHYSTISPVVS